MAGGDGWCSAATALLKGNLHRVASDAKRWSGDTAEAAASCANGQREVAAGLTAVDGACTSCGSLRWPLRDLAARLQLQLAKCRLAQVQSCAIDSGMRLS